MSLRKQTPSDFLKQIIGRPVVVKLNSGVDYRGNDNVYMYRAQTIQNRWVLVVHEVSSLPCSLLAGVLACLDGYMNIAIEQTEEYVNGQLKNKYGDAFLRGNNGKPHMHVDVFLTFQCSKIHMHTLIFVGCRTQGK